jgi:SAM-dependent methyltransferase
MDEIVRGAFRDRVIETAGQAGSRVLELCCGTGWLSLELARRGAHVTGLDVSEGRIAIASDYAKISDRSPGDGTLEYRVADLNSDPLDGGPYDCVVAWDGLHHVAKAADLLDRVNQALAPCGRLVIFEHLTWRLGNSRATSLGMSILVPWSVPVRLWRRVFGSSQAQAETESRRSPFEGVAGDEIVGLIRERFDVEEHRTTCAMSRDVAPFVFRSYLPLGEAVAYAMVRMVHRIDRLVLRSVPGQYTFLVARKRG